MNDLFSSSFSRVRSDRSDLEMSPLEEDGGGAKGINLDKFFDDVESIKEELKEMDNLQQTLKSSHEHTQTLHDAKQVKKIHSKMESDVSTALKKAKMIKLRLEALDRSNAANLTLPGCGVGSSSDRTRSSVSNGLRTRLREQMETFNSLRNRISSDHRDTVQRRFHTVTGENPTEETVDLLISTGESENFLQKAIQEQGRGRVMDTIMEIQERQEGVKDMERSLNELHQTFLDMAVLVEAQGEQLQDIESQVTRANSFVRGGTQQLQTARKHQKSSRKWTCFAIILLLVIIFIILLSVRPWQKK